MLQVDFFGSFRTRLFLPTSDIDMVVIGNWNTLPLRTLEHAFVEHNIADASTIKVLDRAAVHLIPCINPFLNLRQRCP